MRVAAGPSHKPAEVEGPSQRQAAWRFFKNPLVTLPVLVEPLRQEARKALADSTAPCCAVWLLARLRTPEAEELKEVLVDLSGRQMKAGCCFTVPALLAGLHVFLAFFAALDHTTLERLRFLGALLIPFFHSG